MTQQYLIGELSVRLEMLQAASGPVDADDMTRLRHEIEVRPLPGLASAVVRALCLADGLCWDSLSRGDIAAFSRQAQLCAELRQFGLCASLLSEEWD